MIPPSPPIYVYEVVTFSTGLASSAGFFLFCCMCCALCGKGFDRQRGTSRMIGVGRMRIDGSGWGREGRGKRSHASGLFGPDYRARTKNHMPDLGCAEEEDSWLSMLSTRWLQDAPEPRGRGGFSRIAA